MQVEAAGTEWVLNEQSLPQFRMGEPSPAAPLTPKSVVPTGHGKPRDLGGGAHADSQWQGHVCPQVAGSQAAYRGCQGWGRVWEGTGFFWGDKAFYT